MKPQTRVIALTAVLVLVSCRLDGKFNVGGSVTGLQGSGLVLDLNAGHGIRINSNGAFVFTSGVAKGASYAVTVATQPTNPSQTCSVVNGSGTIARNDVNDVLVTCAASGRFAYIANAVSNDISAFSIGANGALAPIVGMPFLDVGATPVALAVDRQAGYLYAVNSGSNDVTVYSIGTTGTLSPVGLPFLTGASPSAIVIDPANRYLYVANAADNTVSAYAIQTGGNVIAVTSPFPVGRKPVALAVDPASSFLYVANYADGTISIVSIDSTTGTLSNGSGPPIGTGAGAGSGPISIAINPQGSYAYVANQTAASLSSFSIAATTGQLTPLAASPTLSTLTAPASVAVTPAGSVLYAANVTIGNDVTGYAITAASGGLTAGLPAATSAISPVSLTIDPLGQFVYTANYQSNDVSVFSVTPDTGALSLASGAPFRTLGSGPSSIVID